ncbi:MAG: hypothetical protein MUF72_10900 [Elainella sp. Prado103]|jgi:hypothetical protein|nr:hypothetical protein [Elainella sp. Prado103]
MSLFHGQTQLILCLEHQNSALYGHLIQDIPSRQLYWFRPFALLCTLSADETLLYDLRQGSDLLCPKNLFRAALDIEVLPLLTRLEGSKSQESERGNTIDRSAQQALQAFLHQLWKADPNAFQSRQNHT